MAKDIYEELGEMLGGRPTRNLGAAIEGSYFDEVMNFQPEQVSEPEAPKRTVLGTIGDIANTAAQTVIATGETAVGLANIPTMGKAGKFLEENLGYRPKEARKILDDALKSDAQRAADRKVDEADGVVDTAKAVIQNPSVALRVAGESVGPMFLGGAGGRILSAKTGMSLPKAAAVGEGTVSAGGTAESIRQQTEDGELTLGQTAIATGSGVLTGLIGFGGGKLAQKLGIEDVDQLVAGYRSSDEVTKKGIIRRVLEGAVQEGFVEELPQSAQEQIAQNIALDKPWNEGLDKAVVLGPAAGVIMGGASQFARRDNEDKVTAVTPEANQNQGPTTSQLLTQNAFADVMGDETLIQQQEVARAQLLSALSQMDDNELRAATTHLAQGDEQLAQQLSEQARNPEVRSQWTTALSAGTQQYIDVSAAIRRDAGITLNDAVETPSAPRIARAVSEELDASGQFPEPPLNSAGFVPEPTPQLQAQLAAVADGRKTAVIMGVDDAQRVNLAGFSVGTAIDPATGQEVLVAARDNGTVQSFVTRADEVGVQQAAGEILGYADPTQTTTPAPDAVAVQQLDESGQIIDEQVVAPQDAGNVQQIQGAQTRVVPGQQALMERTQRTMEEMPAQPQPEAPLNALFSQQTQQAQTTTSPRTDSWVEGFNQSLGLDPASPQAIDPSSIIEVRPSAKRDPKLAKMARAMKEAFGIDLVYVKTPTGALMRRDGTRFNSFNGVASGNTLIMNVDAATPLNTFAHEATHILQNQRPEIYAKLEMAVLTRLSPEKARKFYSGLNQTLQAEGSNANVELEFRSEIVAEAIGEMAQDQKFWRDVFSTVGSDGSTAKSLYDSVIEMLQKLARAFTKAGFIDGVKDLQKVRRAATDAFIEWSAATENANNLPAEQAQMLRQFEKAGGVQQQAPAKGQPRFQRNKFPSTLPDNSPLLALTINDNSEERIALRRALINKHFEGLQPIQGKPVLLTLGGGGGVGKTTVLNRAATLGGFSVKDMQMVAVNADDIKEMIPEYGQIKAAGDWRAAATVHDESSLIAKAVRFRALGMTSKDAPEEVRAYMPEKAAGKYNLLMDATMSKPSTGIPLIQQAAERGYITTMMAVVADPATAVERAVARGEKSGRFVPEEVLAEAHLGFLQSLDKYASVVNSFRLWDNNGTEAKEVNLNEHRATIQQYIDSARRLAASNGKADGGVRQGGQQRGQLAGNTQADGAERAAAGQRQPSNALAGGLSKFSRENIAAAARGDNRAASMEVMANAPDYMARLGIGRTLPVVIEAQTIFKVATGKGYGGTEKRTPLTVDQIERLPQLLAKPAAVFNDPTDKNSLVVMTSEVIDGFDPLVVAISKSPEKKQLLIERVTGSVERTSNAFAPIKTAFGKDWDSFESWLRRDDALRMVDAAQIDAAVKAGMPKQLARKLREAQITSKGKVYAVGGAASLDQIAYAPQQSGVTSSSNPVSLRQAPPERIVSLPERTGKTLSLKKPESRLQRKGLESAGGFSVRTMKDGSIEVYGNAQDIRAQLPEGVVGRAFPEGLKFTTSDAPRVKAALSGETLAYSRQGKVYDKLPMNSKGEYIGAPAKFNKPGNIFKLRKILKDLTLEGAPGRFWYERSSEEVLRMTGGNVQEARKFVALLSIYSPQAKVDANSTFAVRAWAQHKAGQPIKVKTEVQDTKATEALQDVDKFWSGEKTGNFYNNLLRMIDPSSGDKQGATIDMWMMRAGQYSNDAPTATQYAFMENETNRIAQELGWEPQQVQAAIWVAMKARMENEGVKKRTEAISEKRGWIKFVPGKDGKGKKRVIIDEQKHRDNWLRESFALNVSAQDTAAAKFDFADGILRHIGQVSWEPRPSTKLPILPGIHSAPYSQQLEFYQAVQQALYDENGADMLAQKLGLLVDGETQAPGIWESEVSAGGQKRIAMAPAAGKEGVKGIDPAQKQLLDAYSATLGLLLRQDGVGYHRPFYKSNKGDQNGVELRIGRPFTPEEAKQLWTSINTLMYDKGYPQWEQHVGMVSSPQGMRVIKFWGLMDNNAFRAAIDKSVDSLPFDINESTDFAADGNLVDNNWQENPNGQNYQEVISGAGRSDLLGWSRDVLAPRVQAVFEEYAAKYNWGDPGQIRFSRTFAGPAELAGRPGTRSDAGIGGSVQGAIHYGRQGKLTNLSGASFGTGIKGAEQERLKTATDPRIKKRVYFYLPVSGGIPEPEIGLGAHVYSADLSGLYEPDGSIRDADPNAFESKVLDAGYRGYINREQGTAVVLNDNVPVRYMGTAEQFNRVRRVIQRMAPKNTTRTEGNEVVRKADPFVPAAARAQVESAAPSFRMQFGEYRVKADEVDAANAALERSGAVFRFERNMSLADDLAAQTQMLEQEAKKRGFKDADEFVVKDYDGFMKLAEQWRDQNPASSMFSRQIDTPEFKNWFGSSQVVDADGKPKVMYHGTARDISVFRPKQADAIFVTANPRFAEGFANTSADYVAEKGYRALTEEQKREVHKKVTARLKAEYRKDAAARASLQRGLDEWITDGSKPEGEVLDYVIEYSQDYLDAQQNIMPLYVRAEKPFDFENANDRRSVGLMVAEDRRLTGDKAEQFADSLSKLLENGDWTEIERVDVQSAIRRLGFDGFYVVEGGVKNLGVYNPNQLKSAIGNSGAFDPANPDIRFQRNNTKLMTVQEVLDFAKTGNLNLGLGENLRRMQIADAMMQAKDKNQVKQLLSNIGDTLIRLFADSLLPVQRWIENLPLSDLMKQRLAGDMRRADTVRMALEKEVKTRFAERMYTAVDKAAKKTGLSADQIKKLAGTWMTAKYAPKANRHLIAKDRAALLAAQQSGNAVAIAKATADLQARLADVRGAVGATGFTRGVAGGFNDATAAQVVAGIEAKVDQQLLMEIAQPIYDMLKWKKQQDLASGRVTQQMVNSWPNHADYVPLTGDPRASAEYNDVFLSGNQLNQDADKDMNGRKDSVADDGIDAAFTAVVKSVNFAAFQDFKRTLNETYLAAQKNGIDIGLTREPITGIMSSGDPVIMYRDNVVNANGTTSQRSYAFRFDNPELMAAMKKANSEVTNGILTFFQTPTRWYGRLVTQFMPAFAPINFVRDVWERSEFVRTRTVFDANGNKVDVKKVARGSLAQLLNPQLWQGSFQYNFNTAKRNAFRAELEEFIKLGGSSTWGDYLARASADLEADIRSETGLTPAARRKVMEKIESYNNLFEMTYPLAIFMAFKEQGVTPKDAAAATLDLMNFRKRGTVMPGIRALYVFAQPAAQSGYNLARYLSTPTGRKRFMAQFAIGTALYAFLAGLWGDEEDEELGNQLDNLSNFTVERSIPIKVGDMVLKIPVGFGAPQMAWAYAGIVNRIMSGRYEPAEGIAEGAKAWLKAVSPVSPSDIEISERPLQWFGQSIVPTVAKPLFNIIADQTGMGLPLTPQFKDPTKMNYEQARRNTPTFFKELAKDVYEFSGIDLYPDHIKAITDGYVIGPLREITSYFIDNPAKELRGEPGRVPVLASIVDNINDRSILNSIYYRERGDLADVAKEYNRRMEDGTLAEWITPEKAQQAMMYKQFESQERMFGRMRGNLDRMELPEELYAIQRQAIETQADEARRQLLRVALQ